MTKIIGLDRDGTINIDLGRYVTRPDEFVAIPRSIDAIRMIQEKGYKIVVITNQAGISTGELTATDVEIVHFRMNDLIRNAECRELDGVYYSNTNSIDDPYAKPNTKLFEYAESVLDAKFHAYVGDKLIDLQAADNIGAEPILVKTGYGPLTVEQLKENDDLREKTKVFDNLYEFAVSLPGLV